MAFTRFTKNVLNVSALPDRVQNQAQTLKATFDQAGVDIKTALNALIAELEASTSADNIGADVQTVATKTVQAILTAFEEEIANRYTKTEAETLIATGTNDLVADIDVNLTTGVITVTKKDGTVETFDTAIEKVPSKFEFVESGDTYLLKITNVDGTTTQADVTKLMNIYNFNNSDYITFEVTGEGTQKIVTANIKANSIGLDKLSLSVVSTLEGYMNSAKDSATAAKTSETNARASELNALEAKSTAVNKAAEATTSANAAKTSEINAEYWAKQAEANGGGGGGTAEATGASSNPIGTIIPFMGTTPPKDYLTCDGAIYNIADYLELTNHFQNQFGSKNYFGGDGVTTFAVPDLRNEFLRGYGDRTEPIGIHQDGTEIPRLFAWNYSTTQTVLIHNLKTDTAGVYTNATNEDVAVPPTIENTRISGSVNMTTSKNTGATDGSPAFTIKPTNVAVLYCIKYTVSSEEIEIEATPTEGSNKVVTSGGIKEYVDEHGVRVLEASTDNVIDFNTLTEPGVYLIKNCNTNTSVNGDIASSTTFGYDVFLEVVRQVNKDTGETHSLYQRLSYGNYRTIIARQYVISTDKWTAWDYKMAASYISAGTLAGTVKANADATATLATAQVRNITAQTTDLTAGTSTLATGDIVFIYE